MVRFGGNVLPFVVSKGRCSGGSASHCRPHAMFLVFPVFPVLLALPLSSQKSTLAL